MSDREKIDAAAWAAVRGELVTTREPGLCLRFVREVVEHALSWSPGQLYDYVPDWVQPTGYDRDEGHWARDLERSWRDLGMTLTGDRVRGGDILCNWRTAWSTRHEAWVGHVAIALEPDLVVEVVSPAYRPRSLSAGGLCLGPREWTPTTVLRVDTSKLPMRSGGR